MKHFKKILPMMVVVTGGLTTLSSEWAHSANQDPRTDANLPLVEKLKARGFDCQPSQSGSGDICVTKNAPGYEGRELAIAVPQNLKKPKSTAMYLNGFKGYCGDGNWNSRQMIEGNKLMSQLNESASDSILVYPVIKGVRADYFKQAAQVGAGFNSFHKWINEITGSEKKRWTIAGHSGAHGAISSIFSNGNGSKVDSIGLLDATYSSTPGQLILKENYMRRSGSRITTYVSYIEKTGTGSIAKSMGKTMPASISQVESQPYKPGRHCELPKTEFAKYMQWNRMVGAKQQVVASSKVDAID